MPFGVCPDCDEDVRIPPRPRIGQRVICQRCGAKLEVIEVDPIELDWAYDEEDEEEDEGFLEEEEEEEDVESEDFYEINEDLDDLEIEDLEESELAIDDSSEDE